MQFLTWFIKYYGIVFINIAQCGLLAIVINTLLYNSYQIFIHLYIYMYMYL